MRLGRNSNTIMRRDCAPLGVSMLVDMFRHLMPANAHSKLADHEPFCRFSVRPSG